MKTKSSCAKDTAFGNLYSDSLLNANGNCIIPGETDSGANDRSPEKSEGVVIVGDCIEDSPPGSFDANESSMEIRLAYKFTRMKVVTE